MTASDDPRVRLSRAFDARHAVLVVVRVEDEAVAALEAERIWLHGADGVFLEAADSTTDLLALTARIRERIRAFPPWFVGLRADASAATSTAVTGLWVRSAGSTQTSPTWAGLRFGEPDRSPAIDVAVLRGSPETIAAFRARRSDVPIAILDPLPTRLRDYLDLPFSCLVVDERCDPDWVRMIADVRAHDRQSRQLSRLPPGSPRARAEPGQAVVMVDLVSGPRLEIDLAAFEEDDPVLAVCDGGRSGVDGLEGLERVGDLDVGRDHPACLLRADRSAGRFARFRSTAVGEFQLDVFRVPPGGRPKLLWSDDFSLK